MNGSESDYSRLVDQGIEKIGDLDSLQKGDKVFVKVTSDDGREYEFISSSELEALDRSEQQAYAKVPDALIKNILAESKGKISNEERTKLKNKITESRGKFTSFKSAISIFTRIKSQVNYMRISKDKFDERVNDSGLTKLEQKMQDKLMGELESREKATHLREKLEKFPEEMNLKEKVFDEIDSRYLDWQQKQIKDRQEHQKDIHRKKQLDCGAQMNDLAQMNLELLQTVQSDENKTLTKDHISMLNDLSRQLEVHKAVPRSNQVILHENSNLFLKKQSSELKDLYTKVGEDQDGSKAQKYFNELSEPLPTLGQYLKATGLDKAVEMMQFFVPK